MVDAPDGYDYLGGMIPLELIRAFDQRVLDLQDLLDRKNPGGKKNKLLKRIVLAGAYRHFILLSDRTALEAVRSALVPLPADPGVKLRAELQEALNLLDRGNLGEKKARSAKAAIKQARRLKRQK